jgi:hypothetical protein
MTFTDDDLKRLKEWVDDAILNNYYIEGKPELFKDLLARLEAAERVCEASEKVVRPKERIGNAPLEQAIYDALEAWRKAAGKDYK